MCVRACVHVHVYVYVYVYVSAPVGLGVYILAASVRTDDTVS
jgi:hypothetical protein